jgi:hypothetical protein
MLLCCVYSCEFNFLEDVWIQNIDIIWHQTLFYTDKSSNRLYIIYRYTDKKYLSIYSRDYGNYSHSPWHYSRYSLHMSIPKNCVYQYISKTMRTVPLYPVIVQCSLHTSIPMKCVRRYIQRLWEMFTSQCNDN